MVQLFFRFTSIIFILVGLIFWLLFTTIYSFMNDYIYLVFFFGAIIQVAIGGLFGYLIKRLHDGTFRDGLTGAGNRRYFYEKLNQELRRSKHIRTPVSLIFIDIDNFKKVNDTYGHIQGDKVLVEMTDIFIENMRSADSLVRWGGEEFAIILPRTSSQEASILAERLREVIESYNFGCEVTISAGIASITGIVDVDKFVSMADSALYRAKCRKNFVCC